MKSPKGFVMNFLLIGILTGSLVIGGSIVFYAITQTNIQQARINEQEKNKTIEDLGREKLEVDKKIEELEAKINAPHQPASLIKAPQATASLNKQINQDTEKLKTELEALKKQKTVVVEKIVIQQTKAPEITHVPAVSASDTLTNGEIIKKLKPSVVYIEVGTDKENKNSGSGFIIDSSGYILTNAHVLKVGTISVKLSDGTIIKTFAFSKDIKNDIAILKINGSYSAAELGDSDTLTPGDDLSAFGYPFGLSGDVSFKKGTFSRKVDDKGITYLESSLDVHPGNSGGPLVDNKGRVVGINTAIYGHIIDGVSVGETIKFAIPINTIKKLIPALKASAIAPKKYTEQQMLAFEAFSMGQAKNREALKKGLDKYDESFKDSDIERARKIIAEAVIIFASAKKETITWQSEYPQDLPFSDLIKKVAQTEVAHTQQLYEASDHQKEVLRAYQAGEYSIIRDNVSARDNALNQAKTIEKTLTDLILDMQKKADEFFN